MCAQRIQSARGTIVHLCLETARNVIRTSQIKKRTNPIFFSKKVRILPTWQSRLKCPSFISWLLHELFSKKNPHQLPFQRFHVLFNSLFKGLFIFPSRYLFAIGLVSIFSLRWSIPPTLGCTLKQPDSTKGHHKRFFGQNCLFIAQTFEIPKYGALTLFGSSFLSIYVSALSGRSFLRLHPGTPSPK